MLEVVLDVLKKYQVQTQAEITETQIIVVQKISKDTHPTYKRNRYFQGLAGHTITTEKMANVNQELNKHKNIRGNIAHYLSVGTSFPDYGDLPNVMNEQTTRFAHRAGEVLVIDFWATWCGPSLGPMQRNQNMLERNNQKWGNRVRFIGANVEQNKQTVKNHIQCRKWDKMVHIILGKTQQRAKIIKDFQITGIPFICIIDQQGQINYVGYPMYVNIEDKINQLLEEKQIKQLPPLDQTIKLNQQSLTQLRQLSSVRNIQASFKDIDYISVHLQIKRIYSKRGFQCFIDAKITAFQDFEQQVRIFQNQLTQFEGVTASVNLQKIVKIPKGQQCWKCQKILQFPYYWLKWQQGNIFGCIQCVTSPSQTQNNCYTYENNSVLLFGPWQRVSQKGLGHNLQPLSAQQIKNKHQFQCNSCGKEPTTIFEARYLCLGCKGGLEGSTGWIDCCQQCMNKLIEGDELVQMNLKNDGHSKNHPFLRILYNYKGYYQF